MNPPTKALAAVSCSMAVAIALSGCRESTAQAPASKAATAPRARIISAGSAITETVFALGAGDEVVAADGSSYYPEQAAALPRIGYQRALAAEGILSLSPTLVLLSSEAGPPAVIEQLRSANIRVEIIELDPSIAGMKQRIREIARVIGRDPARVIAQLEEDLARAQAQRDTMKVKPKTVVLFAHSSTAVHVYGTNTVAQTMVQLAGGENAVSGFEGAKPLTPEALAAAAPDVIVLSKRGVERVGGMAALLQIPGVALTPAGKAQRFAVIDEMLLLSFGPRTGQAALELGALLAAP